MCASFCIVSYVKCEPIAQRVSAQGPVRVSDRAAARTRGTVRLCPHAQLGHAADVPSFARTRPCICRFLHQPVAGSLMLTAIVLVDEPAVKSRPIVWLALIQKWVIATKR